jgi:hypothetical protein
MVYEQVLEVKEVVHRDQGVPTLIAEPAILAAFRQVYNEAAGILYHHDFFVELNLFLGARPYALLVALNV